MDLSTSENNLNYMIDQKCQVLIEQIHQMLNQGGLYEIHRIMETIDKEEKQLMIKAFIARYKFNFMNHI